jgi:acetolactate synthase-1/2/3 large subunit
MNGAQWLVNTLKNRGVEYVFALCGNGLDPFLKACKEFNIKVIDTRNEQSAAYMADAWGRMTRRLGVVAVSSGPGHTNALTGLANAFWDGGPMMLISGCSSQDTRGLDNFQEIDQVGMAAPVSKYATMVRHIGHLPHEVNKAISLTVTGRPGPVHLTIPADIFNATVNENNLRQTLPPAEVVYSCPGDNALIKDAVKILASAKKPFMVVGSGVFYSQAWEAISEFAKLTDIPIVSHIWDRCCIEEAIPQYMGVTNSELNYAMQKFSEADAILVVGARIDYRVSCGLPPGFPKGAKVIRVDVEPSEINRALIPDVGIVGDPRSVIGQMVEEAKSTGKWDNSEWLADTRNARDSLINKWDGLCQEDVCPVPSLRIIREIKKFLDKDVTFLLDGGNIGRWAHMILFDRHPSHWFTCGASGVVGWGLPGAVAMKLARPDKPLLLLSGDGAAGFTISEIETALRFGTPYVAVIAHDSAWGIVADGQGDECHVACELGEIRFDRVAQALGAEGIFIEDPRSLAPSIEWALQSNKVVIIHVPTQLAGISLWEERFGTCCNR